MTDQSDTPNLVSPMPYDPQTGEILPSDGDQLVQGGLSGPLAQQTALGNQAIKILMSTPIVDRRRLDLVRARLRALCAENGDRYVYSWEVKDRKSGRTTLVEGLTIKAAMDLWRVYGNCFAGPLDVEDRGGHWLFTAVFFDRESGSIALRSFLQRKAQDTGMRDKERAADIIFQIGQSKAIRNVIVNALASEAGFMIEMSKKNMIEWIKEHRGKADEYIDGVMETHAIDQKRIEATIGRVRDQWTVRDFARVMTELRGVDDGMQNEQDAFPSLEAAEDLMAEKQALRADTKKGKAAATPEEPSASEGVRQSSDSGTLDTKEPTAAATKAVKRGRGRPKGSKAKTVPEDPDPSEPPSDAQEPASEGKGQGELGGEDWSDFE